ncbi:uncharacterized protein LOC132313271 isoform X2 [Cornus florida]|uniref:uncharacterized protein LOC132313271 isoform X2 n=1 Tax=Cornus florida TaxID=4283 RepID=UPI0028A2398A|nr:uncharacterized protein LOC132313271 isoform X2 [Cornus florida]
MYLVKYFSSKEGKMSQENGKAPSRAELFCQTHKHRDGTPSDDAASQMLLLFLVLVLPVTIGKLGLLKAQFINSSIKAKEEGKEKEKDDGNVFCFRGSDEAEGYEGVGTGEKVKEAVVKKLGKSKTVDRGGSLSLVS